MSGDFDDPLEAWARSAAEWQTERDSGANGGPRPFAPRDSEPDGQDKDSKPHAGVVHRPRFPVPGRDDELLPVMRVLDNGLNVDEPEPPMRSPKGWPVEVRVSEPAGMHELTALGANGAEEETGRLPPPQLYTLAAHNQYTLALTIERYVAFFKRVKTKSGATVEVPRRLPASFVTHYLHYEGSILPRVSTLATMPIVLPNGGLLAMNGLDRARRTVFRIDPEIIELMPEGRALGAEVAHAMKFLTDAWLVDVLTDYDGKCVLIAFALSIIERNLFGERPAFFITAGKRGGGKTTALNMVSLAVLGKRAPAVPWSWSEEERRKAIFAARSAPDKTILLSSDTGDITLS